MNTEVNNSIFFKLANNRREMKEFYQINLKPLQVSFVKTKEKLDSYNPLVIKRIEKWLSEFNSNGEREQIAGLNMENIDSANSLYADYIETEEKYFKLEQAINKYSKEYKKYKDEDERLLNILLEDNMVVIFEVLNKYYSTIDYEKELVIEEGKKALKEAYDTYKDNIPFTLTEYTTKLVKTRLKHFFKEKYSYTSPLNTNDLSKEEYSYLLNKIINFLKTNMSIYRIYQFIKLNNRYYRDEVINRIIEDLKNIILIFNDNDYEKNMRLVSNIYELPYKEIEYIWNNKDSISNSINKFLTNNSI